MARAKKTKPQLVKKHPDEWQKDLNPGQTSGQNLGPVKLSDVSHRTAADDKELSRGLKDFTNDELSQIPMAPPGVRLEQGAVYLDLRHPRKRPFIATANNDGAARKLVHPQIGSALRNLEPLARNALLREIGNRTRARIIGRDDR